MEKNEILNSPSSDGSADRVNEAPATVPNTDMPKSTNSNSDTGKFDVASTPAAPVQNTTTPKSTNSERM